MSRDTPDHEDAALERIREHLRWTMENIADEWRTLPFAWTARSRSLPLVRHFNQVHITGNLSPEEAVRLADEHQADLPYRIIQFDDERAAQEFRTFHSEERFKREVLLLMALDPRSVGEDTADVVVELEEDEMLALMRSWVAEEHHETPEGTLQQIDEANRREGELWNERALGVRDDDGKPVAVTKLRSLGQTAWVEDVYTAPQARRRGYARRLVTRAVAIASEEGHDFAFILADDECWPKVLYSAVGFRPTGKLWSYRSENVGFYP